MYLFAIKPVWSSLCMEQKAWQNKQRHSGKTYCWWRSGYSSNKKLYECSKVNMDKKTKNHRWKQIACQMYQDIDNMNMYGPSIYSKEVHSNRFWEDTFKIYELFRYKVKPEPSEEALAEPLFLNRNIKVGKKCILFKSWLEKGVYCIGHLIDEEGRFYKYNEFTKKIQYSS